MSLKSTSGSRPSICTTIPFTISFFTYGAGSSHASPSRAITTCWPQTTRRAGLERSSAWGSARTGTRRSGARGATFGSLYDLERERRCHCSLGLSDLLGLSGRSGSTRYAPAAAEAEADPPSAPAGVHVEMMSPAAPRGEPRPRSELLRTSEPVGQAPWSPPELRFQEAVVVGQAIGGGAGAGSEECDSR